MSLTPQAKVVLSHLRDFPHLTSWQAEGVYRIRRLASRIDELRAAGYGIEKETVRDATDQRYTRYSLESTQRCCRSPIYCPRVPTKRYTLDEVISAVDAAWFLSEAARAAIIVQLDRGDS